MAGIDWTKPIVAVLGDRRYPARLICEGDPVTNEGERCFDVEIDGPHRISTSDELETARWWFNLDGSFCIESPTVEFAHIENGEV